VTTKQLGLRHVMTKDNRACYIKVFEAVLLPWFGFNISTPSRDGQKNYVSM